MSDKQIKIWNDEFITILNKLEKISKNNGEKWKAKAYKNASDLISTLKFDITDVNQIKGMKSIGNDPKKGILNKLTTFVNDGKLDIIEKEENSFINQLNEIYGCLLYTSPSPRDMRRSRMPSSA